MGFDPQDFSNTLDRSASIDEGEEDAALALLNVSRAFHMKGDLTPQGAMGLIGQGAQDQPNATRHSSRQPKPVKKHKNDLGSIQKKDTGYAPARGRGRGRGPGRPPKANYEHGMPGAMPPAYGYYAPPMQPQYAPEYTPEYAPQYPPQYAPQYAPPPGPGYGCGGMPGYGPPGYMPGMPGWAPPGPPHGMAPPYGAPAPMPVAPSMPQRPPVKPIQPLGAPPMPYNSGTSATTVKDIRWMQRHLDGAVGTIGRKPGEPAEFDTVAPTFKRHTHGNDADLTRRTVVDLSDYSQDQLQDMADQTVQDACLPPVVRPQPGVRVSRAASYTGSKAFYSGELYVGGQAGKPSSNPSAEMPKPEFEAAPEKAPPAELQPQPVSGGLLAEKVAAVWRQDNNAVWRLMGLGEPPVVDRTAINYLRLILVVDSVGGYQRATEQQLWPDVATKFGIYSNQEAKQRAGHALRMLYMQYVTPIRAELQPFIPK